MALADNSFGKIANAPEYNFDSHIGNLRSSVVVLLI